MDGLTDWWMDWQIDERTDWLRNGLTDWWTDWLIDWLNDWLTDWWTEGLIDWQTVCQSVNQSVRPSISLIYWWTDRQTDWLIDWRTDWLTKWLSADWLTDWLIDWRTDWPIDWQTDRMSDWLSHWLTDWLTDLPIDQRTVLLTVGRNDWLIVWLIDCVSQKRAKRSKMEVWRPPLAQPWKKFVAFIPRGTPYNNGSSFGLRTISLFLAKGWFSNGCRESFAQKTSKTAYTRKGSRSTEPIWRIQRLLVQFPYLCTGSPSSVEAEQGKCK